MKIHLLPAGDALRPAGQPFKYPSHNADYGVEQDFYRYLCSRTDLLTRDPREADWHFLPVYWTRWHLNHDYGRTGVDELRGAVQGLVTRDERTFTICQYDDGPLVDLGSSVVFLASRKSDAGVDIPLLSSPHRRPLWPPGKRYRASFIGRLATHPIRQRMADALRHVPDVRVVDGDQGPRAFVRLTLASYSALAPRGYGGSSFRFFEAMQLGVCPILIGDYDTRPFKSDIDWEGFSFLVRDPDELPALLDRVSRLEMADRGRRAAEAYRRDIAFGRWCRHVIGELQRRS
jgi:hypothetical protein